MNSQPQLRGNSRLLSYLEREWLTLVFIVLGLGFAVGTKDFRGDAVRFPLMIGLVTAAIGIGELVRAFLAKANNPAQDDTPDEAAASGQANPYTEMLSWAWFFGAIGLIYLLGILPSAAISTFFYSVAFLKVGYLRACLWALGLAVSMWLVFGELAGFQLYWGLLLQ